ncbi:hypothetical protein ACEQPO_08605 [Bacillus sp. SL00103]
MKRAGIERQKMINRGSQRKKRRMPKSLLERALTKQSLAGNARAGAVTSFSERTQSVQDALRLSENVERINISVQRKSKKLDELNKRALQTSEAYEKLQKQQKRPS